jgi:hypothetical protein
MHASEVERPRVYTYQSGFALLPWYADATMQDAEEDEEGELADAPQASTDHVKAEEDAGAMEVDPVSAGQSKHVI